MCVCLAGPQWRGLSTGQGVPGRGKPEATVHTAERPSPQDLIHQALDGVNRDGEADPRGRALTCRGGEGEWSWADELAPGAKAEFGTQRNVACVELQHMQQLECRQQPARRPRQPHPWDQQWQC